MAKAKAKAGGWRNRVVGLEYHRPADVADHPRQWRRHPRAQRAALEAVLEKVGIAGALVAYRDGEGRLTALDGHLRKSLDPDAEWPVLVLDVDESEARKLLAAMDPIAAMAEADAAAVEELLAQVETESEALAGLLEAVAEEAGAVPGPDAWPEYDEGIPETEAEAAAWATCPECGCRFVPERGG